MNKIKLHILINWASFKYWIGLRTGKWYCEYNEHIRIMDYVSIMIYNWPVLVVRKMDNPHSGHEDMDRFYMIGILGFTFIK